MPRKKLVEIVSEITEKIEKELQSEDQVVVILNSEQKRAIKELNRSIYKTKKVGQKTKDYLTSVVATGRANTLYLFSVLGYILQQLTKK